MKRGPPGAPGPSFNVEDRAEGDRQRGFFAPVAVPPVLLTGRQKRPYVSRDGDDGRCPREHLAPVWKAFRNQSERGELESHVTHTCTPAAHPCTSWLDSRHPPCRRDVSPRPVWRWRTSSACRRSTSWRSPYSVRLVPGIRASGRDPSRRSRPPA